MYGNYINGPFMMPNTYSGPVLRSAVTPFGNAQIGNIGLSRSVGAGIRSGIGRSGFGGILSGIKRINWSGFLNGTSKTLGVVRDAIPVVKEVRPMISNMKSMIKIASAFNDVTDTATSNNIGVSNTEKSEINKKEKTDINSNTSFVDRNDNEPNFFL